MLEYQKSIQDIIKERTSWRTFEDKPISDNERQEIEKLLTSTFEFNPFGGKNRFKLFDIPLEAKSSKQSYGTYGFIRGAQTYLLGACERSTYDFESFGYSMEILILKLTEFNLGTCWLGGTFDQSSFSQAMQLEPNEFLPAITPVGYKKSRRIKEMIIRTAIHAKKRFSWDHLFFCSDFTTPLNPEELDLYTYALEMVRLAPSARNLQPWRIIMQNDPPIFHFYSSQLDGSFIARHPNFHRMDLGIAVAHFDLTVRELHLSGYWVIDEPHFSDNSENPLQYVISWQAAEI
ncbi:MAG: nitroreductase [Promethearchaeia archaeon]|nr:MAG: nitroreductase [Candidatus Lokiarchaeia archaeon]